ncbi:MULTISPECIES: hypothetical protein [unclassified Caballeronia]|uniref:hypothetical protein n=1 Tax=unclassified Caballeronia TaxID=2646786 RepID=UPI0028653721|nr:MULTISPECIES: hypothetical protein [unclassified Caballeronia]MDR5739827.1 hypothetical protein [Caballeronia sp. LZ016]MDR5808292.1 hypothetical protein [Caballeronia sp. LZ019]
MNRSDTSVNPRGVESRRRIGRVASPAVIALVALIAVSGGGARAQRSDWLDARVTQATIVDTICVSGYVDRVLPSFEMQMRQKDRLLKQRGVDASFGSEYALDHRMPVILGGSPNSPANLDLRRWEGRAGQRRKERLAVYLKRCVCTGDITLRAAQSAMAGDWPNRYPNLSSMSCKGL